MKKEYAVVYLLIGLVVVAFVLTRLYPNARLTDYFSSTHIVSSEKKPIVTVAIDFGDKKRMYSDVSAATAFDALKIAANRDNLTLSGKQYDFGYFVEKIGETSNTKEKAWLYFVNGVSGDVASDKKTLNAGDLVEWKYVKPN